MEIEKFTPKNLIVKSNRLIEAKSRLTVQEQRVLLAAISQIKPSEEEFNKKGYPISIAEFREMADLKGRAYYSELKALTAKLVGRTLVIHEEDGILQTSWLSSAKYVDQKGIVFLNFDERLKPYLIQLKREFTSYQLHYVMKLKSKYSTRIYELLKQYEKLGVREFELGELRSLVMTDDDRYPHYGDFNRNVLKKARTEINDNTDLIIEYEPKKTGRKVAGVKFKIGKNQPNVEAASKEIDLLIIVDRLMDLLPNNSIQNDHKIRELIKKYVVEKNEDYVKWNILYTNSKNYKDYLKYFRKALQKNYGQNYQYQLFEEKEKKAKQAEKEKMEAEEEEKKRIEQIAWEDKQRERIEDLSDVERDMLYEIAVEKYAQKRRKNISQVDRTSYGVFIEAANALDVFLEKEILLEN